MNKIKLKKNTSHQNPPVDTDFHMCVDNVTNITIVLV